MDNTILTGILTSRIETRTKNKETYYYGFFQIKDQTQETPVIFKIQTNEGFDKPDILKGSEIELEGAWANSSKDRPSFTCYKYFLLKLPEPPTIVSLQKEISALLKPAFEKKKEWSETTDFLFKKQKDLEEIRKVSVLGDHFLKAYLLTKQVFYANYQTEHLEQANFTLESYLTRIASELDITKRQMLAAGWREVK